MLRSEYEYITLIESRIEHAKRKRPHLNATEEQKNDLVDFLELVHRKAKSIETIFQNAVLDKNYSNASSDIIKVVSSLDRWTAVYGDIFSILTADAVSSVDNLRSYAFEMLRKIEVARSTSS